jgi:hypothetical protein
MSQFWDMNVLSHIREKAKYQDSSKLILRFHCSKFICQFKISWSYDKNTLNHGKHMNRVLKIVYFNSVP